MNAWKPGDVAMVTWSVNADGPFPAVRGQGRWHMFENPAPRNESFLTDEWLAGLDGVKIRPLVVIDPEDTNDLAHDVARRLGCRPGEDISHIKEALKGALTPTPPRPDEPTGLGAVVEDTSGRLWVRGPKGWTNLHATGRYLNWRHWDDADDPLSAAVVRILSPGIGSTT